MASVKRCPRAILSTPGTSGYYISNNRVLRAVLQKPLRWVSFNRGHHIDFGRVSGPYPHAVADKLLLSAPTVAIA